jgi:hypothetical protein
MGEGDREAVEGARRPIRKGLGLSQSLVDVA